MTVSPEDLDSEHFWAVFERSRVPMALMDRERRYFAVNDAHTALFKYRREDAIGKRTDAIGPRSPTSDQQWQKLLATNELYYEGMLRYPDGTAMWASYAAHATDAQGRWLALAVILSARVEPDGDELIGTAEPGTVTPASGVLTPRELEVVLRIALGAGTRQIASDLFLSPATVRAHVRNAMVKTGAHTRAQLVAIVLGDGLAGLEDLVARHKR